MQEREDLLMGFSDYDGLSYHRMGEILKLEKTRKITESNHSLTTDPYS